MTISGGKEQNRNEIMTIKNNNTCIREPEYSSITCANSYTFREVCRLVRN